MTKLREELPEGARFSRVEQDCVDISDVGQSSFAISGRDQLVGAVTVETWTSEEGILEPLQWIYNIFICAYHT